MKQAIRTVVLFILLAWTTSAYAQEQCSAIMQRAIDLVSEACSATGRNQACHGYFRVEAKAREGDSSLPFNVGEIISVLDVSALTTAPMNLDEGEWGVALLRLQANLPDTLPGLNATFLLLGDTRIEANPLSPDAQPMQIFRLETGVTGIRCAEGPADGLLVQTPQDMQRVKLTVNGVTIEAAGTAFIQAQPDKAMTVSALDGTITVSLGGHRQVLAVGTQVEIPLDARLTPSGEMSDPVAVQLSTVVGLPIGLLPRSVNAPVLDASQAVLHAGAPTASPAVTPSAAVSLNATSSIQPTDAAATAQVAEGGEAQTNPQDPRAALLVFSLAVLVSLLVILLVVIVFLVTYSVVRQMRLRRRTQDQP